MYKLLYNLSLYNLAYFNQLNTTNATTTYDENNSYTVGTPVPLFQRIDKEKKLAEIENN